MFVDPMGLKPTPEEAALIAEHFYTHSLDDSIDDRKVKGGWRLIDTHTGSQGLRIGIYVRGDGEHSTFNGAKEYALVNEGTAPTSIEDWKNNWQQYTSYTSIDMWESIFFAKWFVQNYGDSEITFVGHSKGAAEASMNAYNTNQNAMVFNPTPVEPAYYDASETPFTKNITSYIVTGDVLNKNLGEPKVGNLEYLPQVWAGSFVSQIRNHMMDAVIEALEAKGMTLMGP